MVHGELPASIHGGAPVVRTASDGPVRTGGFANSVDAPAGASWTIRLSGSGTLTVVDIEEEGDYFQMFDNGVAMTAAVSPFTAPGQNPGNASPGGGLTPVPCYDCTNLGTDINVALGAVAMSSGTFLLTPGDNVITGDWAGGVGTGDVAFIAEGAVAAAPEPDVWVMLLVGFGLIGARGRIRRARPLTA
jgi:hypothetical protein